MAALPGGVYIQACSMLPGNHVLASYLRTINGFIFPNTPCTAHSRWRSQSVYPAAHYEVPFITNSTTLQFPKHQLVVGLNANKCWQQRHDDPIRISAWVRATKGHYKGDYGLVVEDDYGEIEATEQMVLFIPRLRLPTFNPNANAKSAAAEPTKKKTKLACPPPVELLGAGMIKQLATRFGCKLKFECIELCKHPNKCSHQEDNCKRMVFDTPWAMEDYHRFLDWLITVIQKSQTGS